MFEKLKRLLNGSAPTQENAPEQFVQRPDAPAAQQSDKPAKPAAAQQSAGPSQPAVGQQSAQPAQSAPRQAAVPAAQPSAAQPAQAAARQTAVPTAQQSAGLSQPAAAQQAARPAKPAARAGLSSARPVIPRSRVQVCTGAVSCVPGKGALAAESYCLDISQQTEWHIGRGASSRRAGIYRDNDIVVDDVVADPEMRRLNSNVSSCQADIIHRDGAFFLRATRYGCRTTGGAPTKVIRGSVKTELLDPEEFFELRNGDRIELGRSVLLQFNCL